jgi:hypothetical protein
MSVIDSRIQKLLAEYRNQQNTTGNQPTWAVHKRTRPTELVRCTIPFVGRDYFFQSKRLLVYASAENLSTYDQKHLDYWEGSWLDDDTKAENRHRKCFDEFNLDDFFPHVHIAPMNNGCLATAVYYLAYRLGLVGETCPRDFYETIAIANYGKYSIETERQHAERLNLIGQDLSKSNIDYASNLSLLEASHPFIKADLENLQPNIIVLPASVYKADRNFIDTHKGNACIIPIYQMNVSVINRILSKRFSKYAVEQLPTSVKLWYDHLEKGGMVNKSKLNYLSVFTYIDEIVGETKE